MPLPRQQQALDAGSAITSAISTVIEIATMPTSTSGRLPQSLPCQISAPRPDCAATSSADSTQDHEMASVIFRPAMMPGRAAGRITCHITAASAGAKIARGADQQRIDPLHGSERVEQHVDPGAEKHDRHLLLLADAEPEDGEGNPGDRRQRPQQRDERIDDGLGGPPHRHHHAERDGDQTGEHEAGEDALPRKSAPISTVRRWRSAPGPGRRSGPAMEGRSARSRRWWWRDARQAGSGHRCQTDGRRSHTSPPPLAGGGWGEGAAGIGDAPSPDPLRQGEGETLC